MFRINKGSGRGYFNTDTSIGPTWEGDSRGPVQRRAKSSMDPVGYLIFCDPEQEHGPVYHLRVNFKDVGRVECTGAECPLCRETVKFDQERKTP